MEIYALIWEAHSSDDRLLGVYSSIEQAQTAWADLLAADDGYPYQFYRIERRILDGTAIQWDTDIVVYQHYGLEDEDDQ